MQVHVQTPWAQDDVVEGGEGESAEVEEEQADDGRGEPLHPQLRRRPPRDVQGTPDRVRYDNVNQIKDTEW